MAYTSSTFGNGQAFAQMGEDARKAASAALDAMSNWRHEMTATSERNSDAVFDKMSAAAKAMGWPAEFVDMTRQQMQTASKMQMQMFDSVMGAWEKNVANPGSGFQMPSFPGMPQFPGMPSFSAPNGGRPGFGNQPQLPGMGDMGPMAMAPLQFWMQAAEMWQKNWQQALSTWTDAQSKMMGQQPGTGSKFNQPK